MQSVRKLPIIAILLCGFSFLIGWSRADIELQKSAVQLDDWEVLYNQNLVDYNATMLASNLKIRNLFPSSFEDEQALKSGLKPEKMQQSETPKFPQIVGAVYRDRQPTVILRDADNSLVSAVPGDILDSGWQIKTIDLNRVNAVLDGKAQEFSVVEYDLSQVRDASGGVEGK